VKKRVGRLTLLRGVCVVLVHEKRTNKNRSAGGHKSGANSLSAGAGGILRGDAAGLGAPSPDGGMGGTLAAAESGREGGMSGLILNCLKAHEVVKLGAFRICRYDQNNEVGIHVREDGSGLTFFDKLTTAGMKRTEKWIIRTKAERAEREMKEAA
jgi:hypothetical protein